MIPFKHLRTSLDLSRFLRQPVGLHPKTETRKIGTLFSEWRCSFAEQDKAGASRNKVQGEGGAADAIGKPVAALSRELRVRRSLLYRWREAYRREGISGFRPIGRSPGSQEKQAEAAEGRIRELERKVGHQAMVIDFLRRAFKRVEELRRPSKGDGGTASMERS
jgi:transposase